jgi:hypothetical protein
MIRATVNIDEFDPSKDMEYEIGLLDKGNINKKVMHVINEDKSGIILDSFELNGMKLIVKERIVYEPLRFGKVNKGSGQLGIYRLQTPNGHVYFALIKDYVAMEGDWRIVLINIREKEWDLKSALMMDSVHGFALADYAFGRT